MKPILLAILICPMILFFAVTQSRATETTLLDHAAMVTDADNATYVQYAVEDLAGYLKELNHHAPQIATVVPSDATVIIAIALEQSQLGMVAQMDDSGKEPAVETDARFPSGSWVGRTSIRVVVLRNLPANDSNDSLSFKV